MKTFRCLIAAIAAGMILTSSASGQATVIYWDTNGALEGSGNTGGDWDNNAYWSTDAAGTTVTSTFSGLWNQDLGFDDVVFSAGADGTGTWTVTSQHHRVAPNLTVEEGHVTLTGSNTLGVRSNGTWSAVTGASLTSERGIAFLNNAVLSFFSSTKNGGAITANGVISGAGSIVVKGPGTVTLGNANTFNGTTTIDGGTLVLGHPGAIGMATSGAKGFTLRSGTLDVNGQVGAYGNTWALGLGTTITLGGMAGATMEIKDSSTAQTGFGHYHNYQDSNPASCMVYDATNNPGMATISAKSFQTVGTSGNTIRRITVGDSTATDVELDFTGTMLITGASDGHNATLLKDGAGAMRISAANNFPKVTIAEGTLIANHAQALGTSRTGTGGFANIVTLAAGTLQAAGEDRSYNAAVVLADDTTSTIGGNEANLTLSGIVSGNGNLIKAGTAALTLSSPGNSFGGTATVEGGLLNVTGGLANNGPSHILIHSAGTTFGANDPRIARTVPNGFDLGSTSVGSTIIGGDYGTTAELLDGIAGADRTVTMAWRQGTTDEKTLDGGGLISDVLNLEGTESDTYVLQMSYSPDALASIWGESALAESICLAWLDGGVWKNAVAGNTGGTPTFVEAAYDSLQHFELGYYGVDATSNVAWAVLNHGSEFAVVVPEPGTLVLLAAALAGLLACRHRKRR